MFRVNRENHESCAKVKPDEEKENNLAIERSPQ